MSASCCRRRSAGRRDSSELQGAQRCASSGPRSRPRRSVRVGNPLGASLGPASDRPAKPLTGTATPTTLCRRSEERPESPSCPRHSAVSSGEGLARSIPITAFPLISRLCPSGEHRYGGTSSPLTPCLTANSTEISVPLNTTSCFAREIGSWKSIHPSERRTGWIERETSFSANTECRTRGQEARRAVCRSYGRGTLHAAF